MPMFTRASNKQGDNSAPREAELPADVDPDSLNRLPLVKRGDLDEQAARIYDSYANPQGRSLAGLQGPGGIALHSPRLAQLSQPLNQFLRYGTGLSRRLTELAILVTAREMDSQFEWTAHEPAALKEGLEQHIIDVVKYRQDFSGLGEKESLIISYGRELLGRKKVNSQTFAHAVKVFGKQALVNLTALMGAYASTSFMLCAFDVQLQPQQKPLLPIP
jgi:4-carboxymuconolactone decarboxylase